MEVGIRDQILGNSLFFPFKLLVDRKIGYLKISENTLKKSSFLDSRIKDTDGKLICINSSDADNLLKKLNIFKKTDLIHIFHISHVGSTFLSKLLESISGIKVLREPNILRNFVREYHNLINHSSKYEKNELDSLLCGVIKSFLCGKESKVLIKHSSHNLNLPLRNLQIENINQKEILLYTSLQNFLSHAISSEGLRADAEQNANFRLNQFNSMCYSNSFKLDELRYLQIVSIVWMLELSKIITRKESNNNSLLINFDHEFTENKKEETVTSIVKYILDNNSKSLEEILNSRYWFINPKNEKNFSFNNRAKIIRSNWLSATREIEITIDWVKNISCDEPFFLPLLKYIE